MFYSLHNLVLFSLNGPASFSNSYRYLNYKVDSCEISDLDFIVNIGNFKPNLSDCLKFDDKYYIKRNYLYCKTDQYKLLKWELEINGLETGPIKINIKINSHFMRHMKTSYVLLEGAIIDPLIHYILIKKGAALLHASCISKNGKGILFIARGGAGKTTISTNLIQHGFTFISDNYTIITASNGLLGFVEPLNLFSYNLNKFIKKGLTYKQKAELFFKKVIYSLSMRYVKLFLRVMPSQIFTAISSTASLHSSILLIPHQQVNVDPDLHHVSKSELIAHISANQKLEFPYLDKYFIAYSYAFPMSQPSNMWEDYSSVLDTLLSDNSYLLDIPSKYDERIFKSFLKLLVTC